MSLQRISSKNNFLYLCLALIGMLLASAVTNQFPNTILETLFSAVLVITLLIGVKSLHTQTTWKRIVYFLAVILGSLVLLLRFYPSKTTLFFVYLMLFLFFMGSFKVAVRQILFKGKVDSNKIIGSLSLYLLIGLIWTTIYLMLLTFDPDAFNGIEVGEWEHLFFRVAYYSFVTLTTLGYGDVSPVSPLAEFFASLEAITGVFYMAIFVSSLINLAGRKVNEKE
ncbi:potassium channel family protein [Hydrogenimonas urashimensis]|uniref:potassium channel family protein n=1 Tax=Hydrogenimonas urashimensis TaxID=2740515 RepID=UPI0019152FC7|nr:potassium channel family protein [Hydrogenimonas urashimensis]